VDAPSPWGVAFRFCFPQRRLTLFDFCHRSVQLGIGALLSV
jgi:hypothetical protein